MNSMTSPNRRKIAGSSNCGWLVAATSMLDEPVLLKELKERVQHTPNLANVSCRAGSITGSDIDLVEEVHATR